VSVKRLPLRVLPRVLTPCHWQGSILAPSEEAGVVGGNVLTSQRVTDVILSAFKACANSQVRLRG
jgi:N-methylhydantoinase B/oxoprolinase/acetone carboxylase alpha subunit